MTAEPYDVGWGKPPKAHNWPPGRSGHSPGRPRRPRKSVAELIVMNLMEKVEIMERGRLRKVTYYELILRQIQARLMEKPSRRLLRLEEKYEAFAQSMPIRRKRRKTGDECDEKNP